MGKLKLDVAPEARDHWVRVSGGDARILLNALEVAVQLAEPGADGVISIGLDEAAIAVQQTPVVYDHDGDQHYDVISAFIKSMRGSDPDAVLHWLARMLKAGEDPVLSPEGSLSMLQRMLAWRTQWPWWLLRQQHGQWSM